METIYNLPEPWLVIGKDYQDLFVQTGTLTRTGEDLGNEDEGGLFHCFPIDDHGVVHDEEIGYAGETENNYIHIGKKGQPVNGYSGEFIRALAANSLNQPLLNSYHEIKRFIEKNDTELYFGTKEGEPLILDIEIDKQLKPIITYSKKPADRCIVFDNAFVEEYTPESAAKTVIEILDEYFKTFPKPDYIEIRVLVWRGREIDDEFKNTLLDILLTKKIRHDYVIKPAAR